MTKVNLGGYSEKKEKRHRRICWYFFNIFIYPLLSNKNRARALRLFGAKVGKRCRLYRSVKVYAPWKLCIDDFVCIGPKVEIYNKTNVFIERNVVISQGAYLCTASHDITSPVMALVTGSISVGSNVWIAAKATILPGVTIEEGSVVGACAVVAKDVPPWSVVVGNPARVVGKRELKDNN